MTGAVIPFAGRGTPVAVEESLDAGRRQVARINHEIRDLLVLLAEKLRQRSLYLNLIRSLER